VEGWIWDGHEAHYDARTVFDYIDGAGELFLAYGFDQLAVRRFEKAGQPPLTIGRYRMASAEGAFGVFSFERRYVWPYKALIVGTDPVAVDTVGARLLQAKRVAFFGEDRALDVTPHHIQAANTEFHLGVSDLRRIEVVKLGWMEDALI
jgi:hypothetical protein